MKVYTHINERWKRVLCLEIGKTILSVRLRWPVVFRKTRCQS